MSPIERAAHALSEAGGAANWDHAMDCARAVLHAIREPSEAMLAAAIPEPTHLYDGRGPKYQKHMKAAVAIDRLGARQTYQYMIDAALSEGGDDQHMQSRMTRPRRRANKTAIA